MLVVVAIIVAVYCALQIDNSFANVSPVSVRIVYVTSGCASSFLVTALVFAAAQFNGCPAVWAIQSCHSDDQTTAVAVLVSTLVVTFVLGLAVQLSLVWREVNDDSAFTPARVVAAHIRNEQDTDMLQNDYAARRNAGESVNTQFDTRWYGTLTGDSPRGKKHMMARGY